MNDVLDRVASIAPTLFQQAGITLWLVGVALLCGGLVGLIAGVLLTVTRRGGVMQQPLVYTVLNVIVNTFRPIPFIIFATAFTGLVRAISGRGIGNEAFIVVLSLAAVFGIARIVEQNLITVDPGVIEAARAMGAGPIRIILTVILPEGLGPLILGYTFATIAIIDMSAVAGIIGGEGLGNYALAYGYRQFDDVVTWSALIIIVVITQIVQVVGNVLARMVMRR